MMAKQDDAYGPLTRVLDDKDALLVNPAKLKGLDNFQDILCVILRSYSMRPGFSGNQLWSIIGNNRLRNRFDPELFQNKGKFCLPHFVKILHEDGYNLQQLRVDFEANATRQRYEWFIDAMNAAPWNPLSPLAAPPVAAAPRVRPLPADEKVLDDNDPACVICQDNVPKMLANPCGHAHYCVQCSQKLLKDKSPCPMCHDPIESFIPVFRG